MLANPQKFQALFLNCKEENFRFDLDNVTIIPDDVVKHLGVHLDSKLNFENHISHICKKAGNHPNVLKRLSKCVVCSLALLWIRQYDKDGKNTGKGS